ncbi:MAG: glycosyltransferase [Patescibacteria group bacterium]|jgi:glycosyltransferase involved in cell wall biosynthesis
MNQSRQNKIKIVYVMPSLDKGGAERFITDLILNLDSRFFNSTLILFKRGGDWLSELSTKNIPVIILEKKHKIDLINFWQLFKVLKKINPEIVHTQLGGDIYGRLAAKLLKIPVILSTEQNVNPDEKLLNNIIKRITGRYADKIVAISQAVKSDLISRYRTKENKIIVIPNGLEINKFLNQAKNSVVNQVRKNKPLVFGTIGRLSPQKGYSGLIRVWKQLKQRGYLCLIAGVGPLAHKLKDEIAAAKLKTEIKLVGPVESVRFLNSLDVFVFPSLWEGQGLVLLEAGLIGLPIIASSVDGIREIIDEGTGWPVPAGDEAAWAAKIYWLANNIDSPEVNFRAERLRERIINNYDISKIAKRYQVLYFDLLNKKNISHENITS